MVKLKIPKFNDAYMLKQNPTTQRVYMSAKQDWGINVIFHEIKKNCKQYFFYVSIQ